MVHREEVVQVLEYAYTLIGSLDDLDELFKEEARSRLRRVVEIICIPDMVLETVVEWEEMDFNALSADEQVKFQKQLTLVLEKVEALEKETEFCRDDMLWDCMYMEHGIKRKRMAQLVEKLTSDGMIRSVKPGYYKRARTQGLTLVTTVP